MIIKIIKQDIKNKTDLTNLRLNQQIDLPEIGAFDTETNGLNIIFHKPFILQFGYFLNDFKTIKTYALDLETYPELLKEYIDILYKVYFPNLKIILGHNVTFDMHMKANINYPIPEKFYPKLSDTQIYIRLGEDPIVPDEGGAPLRLKDYCYRYIWKGAKFLESQLKQEIKMKKSQVTKKLLSNLLELPLLDEYRKSGKEKKWTKGMVDIFLKDKLRDVEDLPKIYQPIIREFEKDYEETENYQKLNRENVIFYAHYDIVLTLLVYLRNSKKIKERALEEILEEENEAIPAFYDMERAGKLFDLNYAKYAKKTLKKYILDQRQRLKDMLGQDIAANQSVLLKEVLNDKFDLDLEGTDKKILREIQHKEAKEIGKIITELRSLLKWYSTYLVKWIEEAEKFDCPYIYPTYNQVGAVTGRASSPYQQFPKEALKDHEGNTLYHPRKMLVVPEDYDLFYFDYSSMEMRMLAIYSTLLSDGDLNLCRLFIPFHCHEKEGKWYHNEDTSVEWHKAPPHDVTTQNVFGITKEHPEWSHYRSLGKQANFAIIYGASPNRLATQLDVEFTLAKKLYDGFYQTFPSVRQYDAYIKNSIYSLGYVENVFGRRYYNINAHKGKNYLIQGSCADYTKRLLPQIRQLLEGKQSKLENYLHDEFSFRIHKTERYLIPEIKTIMEQLETQIPMTVDVEIAEEDWSNKHDFTIS